MILGVNACTSSDEENGKTVDKSSPSTANVVSVSSIPGSGSKLNVTWTQSSDDISSSNQLIYHVWYSDDNGESYAEGDSVLGSISTTLKYLRPATSYKIYVTVEDESGNMSGAGTVSDAVATNGIVSFSNDIAEIIGSDCAKSRCHTDSYRAGDISLDVNVIGAQAVLTKLQTTNCSLTLPLIVTTSTDPNVILGNSYLDDLLDPAKRDSSACRYPMPPAPNEMALSEVKYGVIYNWLLTGANP